MEVNRLREKYGNEALRAATAALALTGIMRRAGPGMVSFRSLGEHIRPMITTVVQCLKCVR